jgi:hypothetical protein
MLIVIIIPGDVVDDFLWIEVITGGVALEFRDSDLQMPDRVRQMRLVRL